MVNNADSELKISIHHARWERQGNNTDPILAAHLVHKGKPVDCYDELAQEYAERLDLQPDDRVLEIGCGSGVLLQRIKPLVMEIAGTDFSANMLNHIKDKNIETHVCEARTQPFEDEEFDKVYCHGVFQYFPDEEYASCVINEMLRVCKEDGTVLIGDIYNGYLKQEYLISAIQLNVPFLLRPWHWLKQNTIKPVYYKIKHGHLTKNEKLFLSPLFFKDYFRDSNHLVFPLIETVATKPEPFLKYKYDVLIFKNRKPLGVKK